jgi:hypothetical protein
MNVFSRIHDLVVPTYGRDVRIAETASTPRTRADARAAEPQPLLPLRVAYRRPA